MLAGQVQVQLGGRETAGIRAHLGFSTGKPSGPVKKKWARVNGRKTWCRMGRVRVDNLTRDGQGEGG